MVLGAPLLLAQQPQTQTAPLYDVNAKYVNGVAPGYAPTAGSGLTLNLGGGTANCSGTVVTYAAGTLTMTASTTNYVYLNTASSCVPAVKTTAYVAADIPIATVVAGSSTITSIADVRTPFVACPQGSATQFGCVKVDGTTVTASSGVISAPGGSSSVSVNGSAVSSPNFNGTTPTPPAGNVNVTWQASSSNVSAYVPSIFNPSTTNYTVIAVSALFDDSNSLSTAVASSSWGCTGSTGSLSCTATTTADPKMIANYSYVDASTLTGWPARTAPWSRQDTNYGSFLVTSESWSGSTGTVTWTDTNSIDSAMSGSGGSIYDASEWGLYKLAHQPFFWQHGTVRGYIVSAQNANASFSTYVPSCASPDQVIIEQGQDDISTGRTEAQIETDFQGVWSQAHTAGCLVSMGTITNAQYGAGAIASVWQITGDLNTQWITLQAKSQALKASGNYYDFLIDWAGYFVPSLNSPVLGASVPANDIFAWIGNQAMTNQSSVAQAFSNLFTPWRIGALDHGIAFSPGGYTRLHWLNRNYLDVDIFDNGADLNAGNWSPIHQFITNATGNYAAQHYTISTHFDFAPNLATSRFLCNLLGVAVSSNNSIMDCYYNAGSGSGNNYRAWGGSVGGSTTNPTQASFGLEVTADNRVILPQVATTASTSPLCPNGTGGALTTAGCSSGSMVYPGAGVPVSTGSAWSTSLTKYGSQTGVATTADPGTTAGIPMQSDGSHGTQPSAGTFTNSDFCTYATTTGISCNSSGSAGGAFAGGLGGSYQDATEIAAPANPSSGNDRLYLNSTSHQLACITSSGGNCMPSSGANAFAVYSQDYPDGSVTGRIGLLRPAPYGGTLNSCTYTPSTADASTDLVFNVKYNGTSILSGSSATITHGATLGTAVSLTLTGPITITALQNFELDGTSGTSSWSGVLLCKN